MIHLLPQDLPWLRGHYWARWKYPPATSWRWWGWWRCKRWWWCVSPSKGTNTLQRYYIGKPFYDILLFGDNTKFSWWAEILICNWLSICCWLLCTAVEKSIYIWSWPSAWPLISHDVHFPWLFDATWDPHWNLIALTKSAAKKGRAINIENPRNYNLLLTSSSPI